MKNFQDVTKAMVNLSRHVYSIMLSFFQKNSILIKSILFALILVSILSFSLILIPFFQEKSLVLFETHPFPKETPTEIQKEIDNLNKKLNRKTPSWSYLVINTAENKFRLYSGKKVIRRGICSTGSYVMLEKDDQEKWIFKTPKGVFTVGEKKVNPVWTKPDWAFVEEGLPVPPTHHPSRYEYGVLGEYSLSLGGGYLIHGTLYKRFLGMPVTHGCIRMNDDDLEAVYRTMPSGSKVYIY
ncbi:MAG: L,D-transpeptidase [Bacteroidetes bacterium]|nr:L,D-transpeptidase [Bacteroidota bacterium]